MTCDSCGVNEGEKHLKRCKHLQEAKEAMENPGVWEIILAEGCEPEKDPWFNREIASQNLMTMMPDKRPKKECSNCIYWQNKQCVKELVNNGYCVRHIPK